MRANDRSRAWIVVVLLFIFVVINFADKAVIGIAVVLSSSLPAPRLSPRSGQTRRTMASGAEVSHRSYARFSRGWPQRAGRDDLRLVPAGTISSPGQGNLSTLAATRRPRQSNGTRCRRPTCGGARPRVFWPTPPAPSSVRCAWPAACPRPSVSTSAVHA